MAILFDPIGHHALPDDGNQAWGAAVRQNFTAIAALSAPTWAYFVSPWFTDGNIHNAGASGQRHFSTIQAAIDAIPANYDNGSYYTIYVYPGQYRENVTINKSVAIVGITGPQYRGMAGAAGAVLIGSQTVLAPVISINPPESQWLCVHFGRLSMFNDYRGTEAQIAGPYLVNIAPQSLYGANPVHLSFQDCDIRAQTWGLNNDWESGIAASGWNYVYFRRVAMSAMRYGGGLNNGGVHSLFKLDGSVANGKSSGITFQDCALTSDYAGTRPISAIGRLNNNATAIFYRSAVRKSPSAGSVVLVQGAAGTNANTGIGTDLTVGTAATLAAYGNIAGVDMAPM